MFINMTSTNWNTIMYNYYSTFGVRALLFFAAALFIGYYTLLNLSLAIFLNYM